MALLEGPISPDVIKRFKGVIDIYQLRGKKWVARKWPVYPPREQSPEEKAAHCRLQHANDIWACLSLDLKNRYRDLALGTGLTSRDIWMKHYFNIAEDLTFCSLPHLDFNWKDCPDPAYHRWSLQSWSAQEFPAFNTTFDIVTTAPGRLRFWYWEEPPHWEEWYTYVRGQKCVVGNKYTPPGPCNQFDDWIQVSPRLHRTVRQHSPPFGPGQWWGFFVMGTPNFGHLAISVSPWVTIKWPGVHGIGGPDPANPPMFITGPDAREIPNNTPFLLSNADDSSWCRETPLP